MKKYFDEPQEIIGWIVAAAGLALSIASLFVDALPVTQSVAIGGSMVLAGVGMVTQKFLKYAKVAVDLLEEIAERQRKDDKPDSE